MFSSKTIVMDDKKIAFLNPFGLTLSSQEAMNQTIMTLQEDPESIIFLTKDQKEALKKFATGGEKIFSEKQERENSNMKEIKDAVADNIDSAPNESVRDKYIWFETFMKWYKSDAPGLLQFQYINWKEQPGALEKFI